MCKSLFTPKLMEEKMIRIGDKVRVSHIDRECIVGNGMEGVVRMIVDSKDDYNIGVRFNNSCCVFFRKGELTKIVGLKNDRE